MDIAVATRPVRPDDASLFCRLWEPPLARDRLPPLPRSPPPAARRGPTGWLRVDHDLREAARRRRRGRRGRRRPLRPLPRRPLDPAEVAVVVEDAWQGVGVGRQLLEPADRVSPRSRGVRTLTATVQPDNDRVIGLIRAPPPRLDLHPGRPTSTTSRARSVPAQNLPVTSFPPPTKKKKKKILQPVHLLRDRKGPVMTRLRTAINKPPFGPRPVPPGARARGARCPWPPPSSPPTSSPHSPPAADPATGRPARRPAGGPRREPLPPRADAASVVSRGLLVQRDELRDLRRPVEPTCRRRVRRVARPATGRPVARRRVRHRRPDRGRPGRLADGGSRRGSLPGLRVPCVGARREIPGPGSPSGTPAPSPFRTAGSTRPCPG